MQNQSTTNSKVTLVCAHCGKTYERWPSRANRYVANYCSAACYHASQPASPSKVTLVCPRCGKTFQRWPSHAARHTTNYCSRACATPPVNKLTLTCQQCGKTYQRWPGKAHCGEGTFCSNACASRNRTKEKAGQWKGGRTVCTNGYVRICKPGGRDHDVYEHRLVMEQHLGRPLRTNEHIHHLNGDKTDNRLDNLVLTTNKKHASLHRKYDWSRDYPCCVECGTTSVRVHGRGLCHNCYNRGRK